MKTYAWNSDKNEQIRKERGISFQEIVLNIQLGHEAGIFEHPNQDRHHGQKVSVVLVESHAFLVLFVGSEDEIFLKTIIPSGKATKQYVGDQDE
jgi:uncharacterized DUF497 family protein